MEPNFTLFSQRDASLRWTCIMLCGISLFLWAVGFLVAKLCSRKYHLTDDIGLIGHYENLRAYKIHYHHKMMMMIYRYGIHATYGLGGIRTTNWDVAEVAFSKFNVPVQSLAVFVSNFTLNMPETFPRHLTVNYFDAENVLKR